LIPNIAAANPYPSVVQVSGLTAAVYRATVTLSNLSDPSPERLEVLLVGPNGRNALLMSDCGEDLPVSNVMLTFDDTAASSLPDFNQIVAGVFKPSDYIVGNDAFPAPAPSAPYTASLSLFKDTDPNGAWLLYVLARYLHGQGTIASWSLTFATLDPLADLCIGNVATPEPVATGSNITYLI